MTLSMRLQRLLPALALVVAVCPLVAGAFSPGTQGESSTVKVEGYAEFKKGPHLIVDGQRVGVTASTKFRGPNITGLDSVPLGYEVKVEGIREADGSILATRLEAKPNGQALFETDVVNASDQAEAVWIENGMMFEPLQDGRALKIGDIKEHGPEVDRVRRIMNRLTPAYVSNERVRVRVVETKEWNASAMGNGAVWVYTGLMNEMNDDELAVVLGHELAHYTHEHSRRNARRNMITQMIAAGAVATAAALDNQAARTTTMLGAMLGLTAFQSGYSRDLEDQADRVGLRYVSEGGYDVGQGPGLWGKFRDKYGEDDKVSNFFFGSHSRPSDRIRNINRELRLNYASRPGR
jgi:Zn-dependent protease with chaperone function